MLFVIPRFLSKIEDAGNQSIENFLKRENELGSVSWQLGRYQKSEGKTQKLKTSPNTTPKHTTETQIRPYTHEVCKNEDIGQIHLEHLALACFIQQMEYSADPGLLEALIRCV